MNDLRSVVVRLIEVQWALEDKAVALQPEAEPKAEEAESCFAPEAPDA